MPQTHVDSYKHQGLLMNHVLEFAVTVLIGLVVVDQPTSIHAAPTSAAPHQPRQTKAFAKLYSNAWRAIISGILQAYRTSPLHNKCQPLTETHNHTNSLPKRILHEIGMLGCLTVLLSSGMTRLAFTPLLVLHEWSSKTGNTRKTGPGSLCLSTSKGHYTNMHTTLSECCC